MTENLLILPILIPLACAVFCIFLRNQSRVQNGIAILGGGGLCLAAALIVKAVIDRQILVLDVGAWGAPWGIVLVADYLTAAMLAVSSVVALASVIYAIHTISDTEKKLYYVPLINFLMMGVNGAFLTGDLFNLYVWFEVMLIASFVLMILQGKRSQLEAGFKYVTINIFSSFIFLAGIGILYGKTGTLNMAHIAVAIEQSENAEFINSTIVLLLVAFGIKSAIFPLFFWLPASYHTLPGPVAALFAGLLTKVGVYSFMRTFTLFFGDKVEFFASLLLILGILTMVTGVFGAASKYDSNKILSFHIISQIGYIVVAMALFTEFALAAALFYTVHHILVKSNLFLVADIFNRRFGTSDLKKMGSLYKTAPFLALLFAIPAMSLGGIPPFSGFWAKLTVIWAAVEAEQLFAAVCAVLVGILTLYSMVKIWAEVFWKAKEDSGPSIQSQKTHLTQYVASIILALSTLWISFHPQPLFDFSNQAAKQLSEPSKYIETVLDQSTKEDRHETHD
ncbi:MAG: hypothetical protein MI748_21485 [Opitutales bacterium]|nr:hypothetical protein [Opitutales bacterium]